MWNAVCQRSSTETQFLVLSLGWSHSWCFYPACTNIPDSQEESGCPAQTTPTCTSSPGTASHPHQFLEWREPSWNPISQTPATSQTCKQVPSMTAVSGLHVNSLLHQASLKKLFMWPFLLPLSFFPHSFLLFLLALPYLPSFLNSEQFKILNWNSWKPKGFELKRVFGLKWQRW